MCWRVLMSKSTTTLLDEERHSDLVPPPGAKIESNATMGRIFHSESIWGIGTWRVLYLV